jgi:hypothetical protein
MINVYVMQLNKNVLIMFIVTIFTREVLEIKLKFVYNCNWLKLWENRVMPFDWLKTLFDL